MRIWVLTLNDRTAAYTSFQLVLSAVGGLTARRTLNCWEFSNNSKVVGRAVTLDLHGSLADLAPMKQRPGLPMYPVDRDQ